MSDTAKKAIAHLLRRIQSDPRLAYHFDPITESMSLLTQAHAEMAGRDVDEFRQKYYATLQYESPRCRGGECIERQIPD